jgi:hypothetical protein
MAAGFYWYDTLAAVRASMGRGDNPEYEPARQDRQLTARLANGERLYLDIAEGGTVLKIMHSSPAFGRELVISPWVSNVVRIMVIPTREGE